MQQQTYSNTKTNLMKIHSDILNKIYFIILLTVLLGSVIAEDEKSEEVESSRSARFNRNERPMLMFKPSGPMPAQDRVIMERYMNGPQHSKYSIIYIYISISYFLFVY